MRSRTPGPEQSQLGRGFAILRTLGAAIDYLFAITFVWRLIAGTYYLRERNLLPLIAALLTDLWTFALSAL